MSRTSKKINENITIHFGIDHAIGSFIDITDKRFRESEMDEQGEGYVCEHSQMFPYDQSRIQLDFDEPLTNEAIIKACDDYIEKIINGNESKNVKTD